jgi:hypothetical protein
LTGAVGRLIWRPMIGVWLLLSRAYMVAGRRGSLRTGPLPDVHSTNGRRPRRPRLCRGEHRGSRCQAAARRRWGGLRRHASGSVTASGGVSPCARERDRSRVDGFAVARLGRRATWPRPASGSGAAWQDGSASARAAAPSACVREDTSVDFHGRRGRWRPASAQRLECHGDLQREAWGSTRP